MKSMMIYGEKQNKINSVEMRRDYSPMKMVTFRKTGLQTIWNHIWLTSKTDG